MRRVVSLWLPRFPTDRLCRQQEADSGRPSPWRAEPLVTVAPIGADAMGPATGHSGLRLVAVNATAARGGLRPGLPLADARALEPSLRVMPADPHGDTRCLAALAGWCGQFSPWTAISGFETDGSAGIWIDITGCDHLFGGEADLLGRLTSRLRKHGYAARAAVADTPGSAWAVARHSHPHPSSRGREAKPMHVNPLPRCGGGPAGHLGSGRDGWGEIVPPGAQVHALTPLPIAALRLTAAQCEELDRLGLRRIADLLTLPRSGLAARFGGDLVRRLDQALGDQDEPISPQEPPPRLRFRMNFAEAVGRTEKLDPTQSSLAAAIHDITAPAAGIEQLAGLADRLAGKLGASSVVRLQPRESHLPERAQIATPIAAANREISNPWPLPRPRPLRLLPRPEPVSAMAPVPDDPPVLFRWRRRLYHVAHADGPERLSPEWWRTANNLGPETRDYYRVEDRDGRRFWLYRHGLYRTGVDPQWFLHGFFG